MSTKRLLVIIRGEPGAGKTLLAQVIFTACRLAGIQVTVKSSNRRFDDPSGMTWEQLAEWHDRNLGGRPARTLLMNRVYNKCFATGLFEKTPDGGLRLKKGVSQRRLFEKTPDGGIRLKKGGKDK